ncbi:head-tail connector protein [Pleionea sp. CnH1-48]|uniref:head-tail connector protein n=1 Tax=Pleionea sp. CnH1-48 TaxID=2954494 RepID=UPI002096F24E|nr:head-tail connector protein [Pleionea sp. CnH1-48]MCO7225771.1 head-tail connector protein [Pleionea sp. CnH1-48]
MSLSNHSAQSLVTLEEIKKHLIIDNSFTEDDTLIMSYGLSATQHVENYLGYELKLDALQKATGLTLEKMPETIKHAVLLLVGHFYNNREATNTLTIKNVPLAFEALLSPYKIQSVG